jgi:carboxypeptidase C (cathepsin A)
MRIQICSLTLLLSFLSCCLDVLLAHSKESDKIDNLPGVNFPITFNQYAGFFQYGNHHGFFDKIVPRNMFYWFVESINDPANDPIVFWTNGGPGCSGLLGFFSEMGPFRPNRDDGLDFNPHSWNQRANMVFLESPEGVGFSYSDSDRSTEHADDRSTAATNFQLIKKFFERFPEFKSNDLYLASESYGGHYIPTLALEVVQDKSLNFKGFSVGNPFTTLESGDYSFLSTAWGHQMIAEPTWKRFQLECKEAKRPNLELCASLEIEMHIQMGKLNPYALDFPSCVPSSAVQSEQLLKTLSKSYELDKKIFAMGKTAPLFNAQGIQNKFEYEPCEDDYITRYLNREDVQAAIHATTHSFEADNPWKKCSSRLKYSHFDSQVSMVPIYKKLLSDPSLDVSFCCE